MEPPAPVPPSQPLRRATSLSDETDEKANLYLESDSHHQGNPSRHRLGRFVNFLGFTIVLSLMVYGGWVGASYDIKLPATPDSEAMMGMIRDKYEHMYAGAQPAIQAFVEKCREYREAWIGDH